MPSASTARRRSGGSRSVVLSIVIPDGATAPIRNPDMPAGISGFRARCFAAPRNDISFFVFQTNTIAPRPRFFQRVRGILPSQPSLSKSEGTGAPLGASAFRFASLAGSALRSAPVRRFFGSGPRFSREHATRMASPSASSSRRLVVTGGGIPYRPGAMPAKHDSGRRSRSHSKTPLETPLVDRDAHIVRPLERPGIRYQKRFFRVEIA